ncbi:MAG TPA: SRPBCC domain-containing protein [Bdellovibrionales bacterium]|nr:SRPBCC domain-containing protein [Bdellovibrionales bacterium]
METMYEMWTNPKHFSKWLAPTGFDMTFIRADIKPGGSTFYYMTGHGMKMYGRAEYLEFNPPTSLAYTQQFCDENEKLSRHPMAPTWPATMLTRVTFAEEGPQKTRVTVVWETYGATTAEELATFLKERAGMTQGWTGSFDKLDEYLKTVS